MLVAWLDGAFELIIAEAILAVVRRTFAEPYVSQRLTPEEQAANVALLRRRATLVPITQQVAGVAPHPKAT